MDADQNTTIRHWIRDDSYHLRLIFSERLIIVESKEHALPSLRKQALDVINSDDGLKAQRLAEMAHESSAGLSAFSKALLVESTKGCIEAVCMYICFVLVTFELVTDLGSGYPDCIPRRSMQSQEPTNKVRGCPIPTILRTSLRSSA